eukprot:4945749-Ditylum_brightwellii.AAC.1
MSIHSTHNDFKSTILDNWSSIELITGPTCQSVANPFLHGSISSWKASNRSYNCVQAASLCH